VNMSTCGGFVAARQAAAIGGYAADVREYAADWDFGAEVLETRVAGSISVGRSAIGLPGGGVPLPEKTSLVRIVFQGPTGASLSGVALLLRASDCTANHGPQ